MKVEEFAWHSLRYPEIVALRAYLAENAAPASGNRVLCAIKQVLYEARKLKMIDPDDYVSIKEVKRIPGYREPCGRALAGCEISSMFDAARSTGSRWQRKRNAAMLAIMFGGGLRRTEIVRLTLERVVEVGGGFELKVLGKGNKERIVPLPTMLTPVVRQWLNERGSAGTWLFPKGRDELTRAMSGDNLCKQLQMLATRAKIESLTPHDARRTFITTLLDIGVDIVIVAGLAGHAKLETTRAYDRRDRRAQKRAVEHLSFQLPESVPHSLEVQPETPTTPNTFPMHLFVSKPLTLVH
jgi:site-specific recombinase XerD